MTLNEFMEIRSLISVAHHVPGRLRLKLDPSIRRHPEAENLRDLEKRDAGILGARLNPMARSLVIDYDPKRVSHKALHEFLTSPDAERVAELAENFANMFGVTTLD